MFLPKYKIVELYGLPGCGKTTLSKSLLQLLKKNFSGDVVIRADISTAINKYWNRPTPLFFILFFQLLKPNYFRIKFLLLRYAVSFNFNFYTIVYLLYLVKVIGLYRSNQTKIIVLDEGILQFLSSIPHDKLIKNNHLIERISKNIEALHLNVLFVECFLDRETIIQRLKERNRNDRFAYRKGLRELLDVKESNLTLIATEIAKNKLCINMQNGCEFNSSKIIKTMGL